MVSVSEENYLKALYHLSDGGHRLVSTNALAHKLETSAPSVTDMMKKLDQKDWVQYQKYKGTQLTEAGQKTALQIIRKHRLWEVFLVEKLDFNWDEVHEVAEQLEHIHSEKLIQELDRFLRYPTHDPHGDPIPNKVGMMQYKNKSLLSVLDVNEEAILVGVKNTDPSFLQYLDKRSIALGDVIEVLHKEDFDQSMHIAVGNLHLNISNQIASNLYVQKT